MEIKSAQQDVQSAFVRGSVGQTVSGLIWLLSAALGTWVSERYAILVFVIVGTFIFPLTQFALRLLIGGGVTIGMLFPQSFTVGGWFTGLVLVLFAWIVQITPRFSKS